MSETSISHPVEVDYWTMMMAATKHFRMYDDPCIYFMACHPHHDPIKKKKGQDRNKKSADIATKSKWNEKQG
jgi:hypothetical protein